MVKLSLITWTVQIALYFNLVEGIIEKPLINFTEHIQFQCHFKEIFFLNFYPYETMTKKKGSFSRHFAEVRHFFLSSVALGASETTMKPCASLLLSFCTLVSPIYQMFNKVIQNRN